MRLISWIWFLYIVVGFVIGVFTVLFFNRLKKHQLKLVWYEWILLVLSCIVFIFLWQTFIASFQEFEPKAAWMSIPFLGIPVILMIVVLIRSLKSRLNKANRKK